MACTLWRQHTNASSLHKLRGSIPSGSAHTGSGGGAARWPDGGPGISAGSMGIGQAGGTGAGGIGTGGGDLATVEVAAKELGGGTGWWRQGTGLTASELVSSGLAS